MQTTKVGDGVSPFTEQRVNKHEVRRQQTRERFLQATRQLIGEGQLATFNIDDICQIAGTSRTAFYLHFSGKSALLDVLQHEMGDWYVRQFRKLNATCAKSLAALTEWIDRFVRGFKGTDQAVLLFPGPGIGARVRGEAVLALGSQIPAFGLIRADGTIDEKRRIELLLLVFQIEQVALHLALDTPPNSVQYVQVLAQKMLSQLGRSEEH